MYGQTKIRTPNIDRLAREGVRLTDHYSGSPVCAPSRAVLLTGLHTGHAYIRDNDEMGFRGDVWRDPALEGQRPLPAGTFTVATMLKRAGYATAAVGKWGLGGPGSEGEPNRLGFDLFYGFLCQRVAHNHYPALPLAQHHEGDARQPGHLPPREVPGRQGPEGPVVVRALRREAVRPGHDGRRGARLHQGEQGPAVLPVLRADGSSRVAAGAGRLARRIRRRAARHALPWRQGLPAAQGASRGLRGHGHAPRPRGGTPGGSSSAISVSTATRSSSSRATTARRSTAARIPPSSRAPPRFAV